MREGIMLMLGYDAQCALEITQVAHEVKKES